MVSRTLFVCLAAAGFAALPVSAWERRGHGVVKTPPRPGPRSCRKPGTYKRR